MTDKNLVNAFSYVDKEYIKLHLTSNTDKRRAAFLKFKISISLRVLAPLLNVTKSIAPPPLNNLMPKVYFCFMWRCMIC